MYKNVRNDIVLRVHVETFKDKVVSFLQLTLKVSGKIHMVIQTYACAYVFMCMCAHAHPLFQTIDTIVCTPICTH